MDKITKSYLDKVLSSGDRSTPESEKKCFYKPQYIGKYLEQVQKKLPKTCKKFC